MRNLGVAILIPGVTAVAAVGLLVSWLGMPNMETISARVPGTDRPAVEESSSTVPLVATLTTGPGQPSTLPGRWPRFRGERFDGIATEEVSLARSWPVEGPPVLWSVQLGEGHAGAAVRDGRVYVLDYDRQAEADVLRCLSLDDGREIWNCRYPVRVKRNHGMSRTVPAVSEQYIVSIGPKCHVLCADAKTGKCLWLLDMVGQFGATVPPWYAGQCPLVEGDRVILAPGGESLLVALDGRAGEVVWKSPNPRGWVMTHASIMPMELAGRKTYVYCGKGGVAGVAADDGSLLWETTDWKISIATVPSPVILPGGRIFFSGGYNAGAAMIQIEEQGGRFSAKTLFRLKANRFGSTQQTPILWEDHLYGVRERDNQLVCLDLEGKEVWASGPRSQFGLGPYLAAGGLLYVLDDLGLLTLAEATPAGFQPLAQAQVLHGHDAWGPMALVHGRLLLRDLTEMACLDVSQEGQPSGPDSPAARPAAKED